MKQMVLQEFFCSGCKGYIRVNINLALDGKKVVVICPECDRKHSRYVKDGRISDAGHEKFERDPSADEIFPTKAAYSKTPHTDRMREAEAKGIKGQVSNQIERNGVPLDAERWLELTARQHGEIE